MPQIVESEGFHGKPGVKFDNREQYELFMSFVRDTHIDTESGKPSLAEFYRISTDKNNFAVSFDTRHGYQSMVSKFMEVTGMMEMDFTQHMIANYVPGKNPSDLPLGRQENATIPEHIVKQMERYKQTHPTPAPERRAQQEQTQASQRKPVFENPHNTNTGWQPNSKPSQTAQSHPTRGHETHNRHETRGQRRNNAGVENPRLDPSFNRSQLESRHHQRPHHKREPQGQRGHTNVDKIVKDTLSQYESHLKQKLVNEKVINNKSANLPKSIDHLNDKQVKLLNRYNAISGVNSRIQHKSSLDKGDFESVRTAVETCQNNKPEWSERPFFQKLTDVLTLGLKALVRAFSSKETGFEDKLKESLPTPRTPR